MLDAIPSSPSRIEHDQGRPTSSHRSLFERALAPTGAGWHVGWNLASELSVRPQSNRFDTLGASQQTEQRNLNTASGDHGEKRPQGESSETGRDSVRVPHAGPIA